MRSSRRIVVTAAAVGIALVAGAAGLIGTTSAQALTQTTVSFDDLGPSSIGTHMVDGYSGFAWDSSSWHYMSLPSAPTNTYLALSGTATSIRTLDGSDFYFDGLDAWSRRGLDASGTFYYILSRNGAVVYDGRNDRDGRERFTGASTTFVPTYTGLVDNVALAFAQGGDDWDHLAIDNFRFRTTGTDPVVAPPVTVAPAPGPAPAPAPAPAVTTYKLTVKTSGKGSVAVSRTGNTFVAGQVITLTATPSAGSTWRGWTGSVTSTATSITITMTQAMTITANFK